MKRKEIQPQSLSLHHNFEKTLEAIRSKNIRLPSIPSSENIDLSGSFLLSAGTLTYERRETVQLDALNGSKYCQSKTILGYDESTDKYQALEGTAYFTSHSLILLGESDYLPASYLTFYFYTRSNLLIDDNEYIKNAEGCSSNDELEDRSDSFETAYKEDYVADRSYLISQITPPNSLLFIDGPLIGGQISSYSINLSQELLESNIIPIFFVKNSSSNLVTNNLPEFKSKFNSDMHWSYNELINGYRTNFFWYKDKTNPKNSKVFCYLKPFENRSPQRIELHIDTYEKHKSEINSIMDSIYYLLLAHGDINNPQVRPIAIAELYARQTLKILNINELLKTTNITPIMNQVRFG